MLEQLMFADQFKELLACQQKAVCAYGDLAGRIDDPKLRDQVEQLQRDKQRHIRLTERLLEIVD